MYEYIILNGFGTDAAKIALKRSECLDPCQILEWVFESCGDSQSPTKKSAEKRSEKGEKKLGKIGDTLVNLEANEDENLSVTPSKLKKRYCLPIQHLLDGNSNLSVYTPTSEEIEAIRRRVAEREARKKMKNEKIQHYPVVDVAEGSGLKASDEVKQQNYRVEVAGRGKKGKVEEIQRNSVAGSGEEEQV